MFAPKLTGLHILATAPCRMTGVTSNEVVSPDGGVHTWRPCWCSKGPLTMVCTLRRGACFMSMLDEYQHDRIRYEYQQGRMLCAYHQGRMHLLTPTGGLAGTHKSYSLVDTHKACSSSMLNDQRTPTQTTSTHLESMHAHTRQVYMRHADAAGCGTGVPCS